MAKRWKNWEKKQKEKNNIKQSSSAMAPQQQTQDHLISSKTILSKSHVNNFDKIMQFAVKFPWNDNRFTHGTESVEIRWKQMWNGKKRRPADREEDRKKPSQIESAVVERRTTEDARTRTHTFCHSSIQCIQFSEIDRCHSHVVLSTRRRKAAANNPTTRANKTNWNQLFYHSRNSWFGKYLNGNSPKNPNFQWMHQPKWGRSLRWNSWSICSFNKLQTNSPHLNSFRESFSIKLIPHWQFT